MALDEKDLTLITETLIAPLVRELRVEIRAVADETRLMRAELGSVVAETRAMRTEMVMGFEGLTSRIDHLILTTGEHWRDHERRLLLLERHRDGNGSGSDEDESGDE